MEDLLSRVFLTVFNMSLTAVWVLLAALVLRLLLRRAPKWLTCLLWAAAGVRLALPFTVETVLSLIPSAQTVGPDILYAPAPTVHTGFDAVNAVVNPGLTETFAPAPGASVNPMQVLVLVLSLVWAAGLIAMLTYAAVSTLRVRRAVKVSLPVQAPAGSRLSRVYLCDGISTPFILGLVRPRVYLPSALSEAGREDELSRILAHEEAHIRRLDFLWKPLGFLLLAVHWFNPLVWVGYILLCRDVETACDERVVKNMDAAARQDYARTLLSWSEPRRAVSACPVAFGEVGVKARVKSVLNYKKPALWVILTAVLALAVVAVCLLTNPKEQSGLHIGPDGLWLQMDDTVCDAAIFDYYVPAETVEPLRLDTDGRLWSRDADADGGFAPVGTAVPCELTRDNFDSLFPRDFYYYVWSDGTSEESIRRGTVNAFRIQSSEPSGAGINPYMLLFDGRGGGWYVVANTDENGNPSCVRWIYRFTARPFSEVYRPETFTSELIDPESDPLETFTAELIDPESDPYSHVIAEAQADIDGDGVPETVTLTPGPTYGRFSIYVNVRDGARVKRTLIYDKPVFNTFETDADGTLYAAPPDPQFYYSPDGRRLRMAADDTYLYLYDGSELVGQWGWDTP